MTFFCSLLNSHCQDSARHIVYAHTYLLSEEMNEGMNEWASIVFRGA